jgi:chorismate dehydratase
MKLGYINYLNCYPFYHHLFENEHLQGVQVVPGYPSSLNKMMAETTLDMSPISAAAVSDMGGRILLLPQFCLSSVGYVGSVILVSRCPMEALHKRTVGLTRASYTSVVLVKILLEKYYHVQPNYTLTAPFSAPGQADAVLLIGNEAMIFQSSPNMYVYDIGEIWLQKTGFPVVFAVFGVRKAIIRKFAPEIRKVIRSYHASIECLKHKKEKVIQCAAAKYPDIDYDINRYFSLLRFNFSDELKKALMFYFSVAGEMGFLKLVPNLEFLTVDKLKPYERDLYGQKPERKNISGAAHFS